MRARRRHVNSFVVVLTAATAVGDVVTINDADADVAVAAASAERNGNNNNNNNNGSSLYFPQLGHTVAEAKNFNSKCDFALH